MFGESGQDGDECTSSVCACELKNEAEGKKLTATKSYKVLLIFIDAFRFFLSICFGDRLLLLLSRYGRGREEAILLCSSITCSSFSSAHSPPLLFFSFVLFLLSVRCFILFTHISLFFSHPSRLISHTFTHTHSVFFLTHSQFLCFSCVPFPVQLRISLSLYSCLSQCQPLIYPAIMHYTLLPPSRLPPSLPQEHQTVLRNGPLSIGDFSLCVGGCEGF